MNAICGFPHLALTPAGAYVDVGMAVRSLWRGQSNVPLGCALTADNMLIATASPSS